MSKHAAYGLNGNPIGQSHSCSKSVASEMHVQGFGYPGQWTDDFKPLVHFLVGRDMPAYASDIARQAIFLKDPDCRGK